MAEYLIKGETLTELADTMRSISNGVPNPCSIEQMKSCLPNIHTDITGNTSLSVTEDGVISDDDRYEIYRTYGSGSVESSPFKITSEPINYNTFIDAGYSYNEVISYRVKGLSSQGYNSKKRLSTSDGYVIKLSYSWPSNYTNYTFGVGHLYDSTEQDNFLNGYSIYEPTFSLNGITEGLIRDQMGKIAGKGELNKDPLTSDISLTVELFGSTYIYSNDEAYLNNKYALGCTSNGNVGTVIQLNRPESLK